ncbi:MAG TPA: ABC transporter permease [Treponema sp.]|nr:MAG: ABC transporter permease [Treponema sp. GWA1_62_8]OHE63167.1 MAG: ABC transporter permease [Treponema sp. GWC1_61_84]HCM25183.1 ABC transporter permease [Treponema sp.]
MSGKNPALDQARTILSRYTNLVTFIVLATVLSILTKGASLGWDSVQNLVIAESVRAFAALGVGIIIITRGIDLSIGFVVCLVASVSASFAQTTDYSAALYPGVDFPSYLPIVAGLATGAAFGLFNGVLIAYGKLPPFIATLGTMSIAKGLQLIYTRANVIGSLKAPFKNIAQGSVGPVPNLAVYVFIASFIVWIVLRHTRQGTHLYAIGGNPQAARVSGINVEFELVKVYTYAGILYGVAGVLQASRLGLANALTANGMELDAIAAVTVGGVSQTGGVGTMGGMIVGVLTLGIINYGMTYLGVDSYFQLLVKGFIILVAVFADMKKYKRRA